MTYKNKGKEIVSAEGIFLRTSKTGASHVFEFLGAGVVNLPVSQFIKETEISDMDSGECTVFIPRWLAESRGMKYSDYAMDDEEDEGG